MLKLTTDYNINTIFSYKILNQDFTHTYRHNIHAIYINILHSNFNNA